MNYSTLQKMRDIKCSKGVLFSQGVPASAMAAQILEGIIQLTISRAWKDL